MHESSSRKFFNDKVDEVIRVEYLDRALVRDLSETRNELHKQKRKVSQTRTTLDALLLKAAQAEGNLAEEFMRLAG